MEATDQFQRVTPAAECIVCDDLGCEFCPKVW
jgi:hypothetical protein